MAAVAAALGHQPWGTSPVEEMGDDGEEAQGERCMEGSGDRGTAWGQGQRAAATPKSSRLLFLADGREGLFHTSVF